MKIGNFNTDKVVLLIAEIGNNHEGNFKVATDLVKKAADCGVGAVKFQAIRPEYFVRPANTARLKQLRSYELSDTQLQELSDLARSLGLLFITTPFDLKTVPFLDDILDAFKIASGDNNFSPLITKVAETGKPTLISTGLSDFKQVQKTIECYGATGDLANLCVLHCVSSYPVPPREASLSSVSYLKEKFGVAVGYSDHIEGPDAAVLSVALGARIIEKHFTLDKNFSDFRDHQLSADPKDMAKLVEKIKEADLMLGQVEKKIGESENKNYEAIRRSIVASKDLPAGHKICFEDLGWMRPGTGLAPGNENKLLGKTLNKAFSAGDEISEADLSL